MTWRLAALYTISKSHPVLKHIKPIWSTAKRSYLQEDLLIHISVALKCINELITLKGTILASSG